MRAASDLTEQEFMASLNSVSLDIDISSKQLFSIYSRLLGFVVDFYEARQKVLAIIENEFTDLADKHLDLLQTKAIRARSQFKTVAQALGEEEYCQFVSQLGLPDHEWGWQQLRLSS